MESWDFQNLFYNGMHAYGAYYLMRAIYSCISIFTRNIYMYILYTYAYIYRFLVFYKCSSMQVLYTDGDEEILNLKNEIWEFTHDDSESEPVGGCVNLHFVC